MIEEAVDLALEAELEAISWARQIASLDRPITTPPSSHASRKKQPRDR